MPPAAKKNCQVILYDLNTENRESPKQCLLKLCFKKLFCSKKDLFKLILTNSKTTKNCLNSRYGGYENIYEVMDQPTVHNPGLVLGAIESAEIAEANWLESLEVAAKCLIDDFSDIGGIMTLQLIFITDLSKFKSGDKNELDKIIDKLKADNIYLYVLGPEIPILKTIKNADDIKIWMNNIEELIDKNNENLNIIAAMILKLDNRVICNYRIGLNLIEIYKNWPGPQPWNVPLSIGTVINFPAQTIRVIKPGLDPKLVSTIREEGSKTKFLLAEDVTKELPFEDVISGIQRHGKFVEMTDEKMFKCDNPRSFNILCFTESRNVPEYLMRGDGSYYVVPNGTDEENKMFECLIDCLTHDNKYVIARRVYNNNYVPKFVVLVPKSEYNRNFFILSELPSSDDVKIDYREKEDAQLSQAYTTTVKDENIYNFLDSLQRTSASAPLNIQLMQDPNSTNIINKAVDKYLDQHLRLEDIDLDYFATPNANDETLRELWKERDLQLANADNSNDRDGNPSDDEFDF